MGIYNNFIYRLDSPGNILFIFPEREEVENENSGPKYIQNGNR